jgi:serine/threonine protein kinase
MPISRENFAKSVVASGLISGDELQEFWKRLPVDARPVDGDGFARRLVAAGKLTVFQASEIIAGRGDRLVLEPYILLDKLGGGGMGQVYKARHRTMKRLVAIKMLSAELTQNQPAVKRFQREAEVAARLSHLNIVQAHDAGEKQGVHYLVMELVEGVDLTSLVKQRGPLPVNEAVDYILQAARGLAYAHGEGVIHRDIKPGNLLLDKRGTVKILDMGLARLDEAEGGVALTATGEMMGTPDYMAPEQALDTKSADARSDVYSLGCTLYRLLTGELPYPGDTFVQMLMAHCEAPIPDLQTKRQDVPEALNVIYQRMIAKDAAHRQQSMAEVVADLEAFLKGEPRPPAAPFPVATPSKVPDSVTPRPASPPVQRAPEPAKAPATAPAVVAVAARPGGLEETIGYPKAKEDTSGKKSEAAPEGAAASAESVAGPAAGGTSSAVVYAVIAAVVLVAVIALAGALYAVFG